MSSRGPQDALRVTTAALLVAACLPLARAFHGLAFFRPVLAALLLSLGLVWAARRLGLGPFACLAVSVAGWGMFVSLVFLPETLRLGILPTGETLTAGRDLWLRGIELFQARPAPVFAEAGLLLITVSGVWAVAHSVDGLVFALRSPVKAIGMAGVLWVAPLAVTPGDHTPWPWAVPFLAAAAALLLVAGVGDLRRWGRRQQPDADVVLARLAPRGAVLGVAAIVAGVLLAGALPGFGERPWYQLRASGGGTTVTDNPIVTIKASLVARGQEPVMRVRTARPVYLRTTSLDVYSGEEEWTNAGIRGAPVRGALPFERPIARAEQVRVDVEVESLPGAVLIPAPYQVTELTGPASGRFHYDARLATVTLARGAGLEPGDTYQAAAAIPAPDPAVGPAEVVLDPTSPLAGLPPGIPESVTALALQIVAAAGAQTPFEQALAVQEELRSWTYSLEPPQGHSGRAMEAFVANRIGYCEQYAGTMAVMLRSLGIPARVAVGFTPGELASVDETGTAEYVVTNRHAHAWVEVLTRDHGWLAFEPTPRDDGNVLVPTAVNLAPTTTVSETLADVPELPERGPADADFLPPPDADAPPDGGEPGAAADDEPAAGTRWVLVALALLAVTGAAVALAAGGQRAPGRHAERPAAQRILDARRRTERVARGLGLHPRPSETDVEYLARVAASTTRAPEAHRAAAALAGHAARVRYAPWAPSEGAEEAEAAARALVNSLVGDLGVARRTLVGVRGELAGAWLDYRGAAGGPYSSRWSPR